MRRKLTLPVSQDGLKQVEGEGGFDCGEQAGEIKVDFELRRRRMRRCMWTLAPSLGAAMVWGAGLPDLLSLRLCGADDEFVPAGCESWARALQKVECAAESENPDLERWVNLGLAETLSVSSIRTADGNWWEFDQTDGDMTALLSSGGLVQAKEGGVSGGTTSESCAEQRRCCVCCTRRGSGNRRAEWILTLAYCASSEHHQSGFRKRLASPLEGRLPKSGKNWIRMGWPPWSWALGESRGRVYQRKAAAVVKELEGQGEDTGHGGSLACRRGGGTPGAATMAGVTAHALRAISDGRTRGAR